MHILGTREDELVRSIQDEKSETIEGTHDSLVEYLN